VNKLIWPSPNGIGVMDPVKWTQTVEISLGTKNLEGATVLTAEPAEGSYTTQYAEVANSILVGEGFDVTGEGYTAIEVVLNEGGN